MKTVISQFLPADYNDAAIVPAKGSFTFKLNERSYSATELAVAVLPTKIYCVARMLKDTDLVVLIEIRGDMTDGSYTLGGTEVYAFYQNNVGTGSYGPFEEWVAASGMLEVKKVTAGPAETFKGTFNFKYSNERYSKITAGEFNIAYVP